MKTALITGASGGIGLELARIHASNGDNLVLVARSADKLLRLKEDLEARHHIRTHLISKDLSLPGAAREVFEETRSLNLSVDYLINNAGVGTFGLFHETDPVKTEQMIQLNVMALTQLTRLFLPAMIVRKCGRIMNVASTAAFQPGPTMAVYFASKAYVLHFSEAISNELGGTGVTCTAFCPGATESGFRDAAAMQESALFKNKKVPSSREVAEYGYRAMMKGKPVAIHGLMNFLLANTVRFTPRSLVVKVTRWMTSGPAV
jgi:uncharacterized protein